MMFKRQRFPRELRCRVEIIGARVAASGPLTRKLIPGEMIFVIIQFVPWIAKSEIDVAGADSSFCPPRRSMERSWLILDRAVQRDNSRTIGPLFLASCQRVITLG